jgi:hypothetical protein
MKTNLGRYRSEHVCLHRTEHLLLDIIFVFGMDPFEGNDTAKAWVICGQFNSGQCKKSNRRLCLSE